MDKFALMKAVEIRRDVISGLLNKIETEFPNMCFSAKPLYEGNFWTNIAAILMNKKPESKRNGGVITLIDLPEDLGLKENAIKRLTEEYNKCDKELSELKKILG